jgi:hypothetical protein
MPAQGFGKTVPRERPSGLQVTLVELTGLVIVVALWNGFLKWGPERTKTLAFLVVWNGVLLLWFGLALLLCHTIQRLSAPRTRQAAGRRTVYWSPLLVAEVAVIGWILLERSLLAGLTIREHGLEGEDLADLLIPSLLAFLGAAVMLARRRLRSHQDSGPTAHNGFSPPNVTRIHSGDLSEF